MDVLANLALGFATVFSPQTLLFCFLGVFLGTFIGVLPGIGSLAAVTMLLPVSFHLEPTAAIILLAGVYYGAEYGGSITSILLNLPGTPSAAVACVDGHPMTRQGRAGVALLMTTAASFIGGCAGIVALILFSPALASLATQFASAEYFAIMALALVAAATVTRGSPVKGLIMVVLGLLLGTVGIDLSTNVQRFTFGIYQLYDGFNLVLLAMGLFGIPEVIAAIRHQTAGATVNANTVHRVSMRAMMPSRDDVRRSAGAIARGTGIGGILGVLPGAGVTIASFIGYALEKRLSRTPERFGHGAIEGVTAPEAANNAAAQTGFIPTLTLGIPGTATMAIILGALMIHGILPGPLMMADHPDVFWGLVASFWIGNVLLVILNVPLIGLWVRLLAVPYRFLFPVIICLICVGVYSVNLSVFDLWLVMAVGLAGYGLRLGGFEPAPLLIGFVLGPMIEENFRRSMLLANGDPLWLLLRPISGPLLIVAAVLLIWAIWPARKGTRGHHIEA